MSLLKKLTIPSLILAGGLTFTGCEAEQRGIEVLSEGQIGEYTAKITKEDISNASDMFRIQIFDAEGRERLGIETHYFPRVTINYVNAQVEYSNPPKSKSH